MNKVSFLGECDSEVTAEEGTEFTLWAGGYSGLRPPDPACQCWTAGQRRALCRLPAAHWFLPHHETIDHSLTERMGRWAWFKVSWIPEKECDREDKLTWKEEEEKRSLIVGLIKQWIGIKLHFLNLILLENPMTLATEVKVWCITLLLSSQSNRM